MNLVDLQFAKKSLAKVEKITLICNHYIQIRFSYRAASHLAPFVYITQFYIFLLPTSVVLNRRLLTNIIFIAIN